MGVYGKATTVEDLNFVIQLPLNVFIVTLNWLLPSLGKSELKVNLFLYDLGRQSDQSELLCRKQRPDVNGVHTYVRVRACVRTWLNLGQTR